MNHESRITNHGVLLGIRTDAPDATIILSTPHVIPDRKKRSDAPDPGSSDVDAGLEPGMTMDRVTWTAGRELSATLLLKIEQLLKRHHKTWNDLTAVVVYEGPGSFTGLRIGTTVANAIAFEQDIPVVGATGGDWFETGLGKIKGSKFEKIVMPVYGAEPNITQPKK